MSGRSTSRLFLRAASFALTGVLAVGVAYPFAEASTPRIERRVIADADVPAAFDGARIVFIADIHAGRYLRDARMAELVSTVNGLEPDVLVLGGDHVGGKADGAEIFYPAAAGFVAREAKVAVLGNHDHWEGAEAARAGLASAGFTLLENDSVRIERDGESIVIAGLEDLTEGRPDAEVASEGIVEGDFSVLVSHHPDAVAQQVPATAAAWDLALAGHTHGGQVTAFGRWSPIVPSEHGDRFRTGWSDVAGVPVLVTNGIGTVTLPVRAGAPPQIHVLELRTAPDAGV